MSVEQIKYQKLREKATKWQEYASEYKERYETLLEDHNNNIDDMKECSTTVQSLEKIIRKSNKQIKDLQDQNKNEIEKLKDKHNAVIEKLNEQHLHKIEKLQTQQEKALTELSTNCRFEIQSKDSRILILENEVLNLEKQTSKFEKHISSLEKQLEKLQNK
jgi:hypothetical protein